MINTPTKYGVTEAKKEQLDHLSDEIVEAEFQVEQDQAVVQALTEKLTKYEGYFASANANRIVALNNKNTISGIVQNTKDLKVVSANTLKSTNTATSSMNELAVSVRQVVERLIYTAESINKLSNLIIRKKAKNPLISDELISRISNTGADANNAVALMLTAMETTFTAQASLMEADSAAILETSQATKLYELISGTDYQGNPTPNQASSLSSLLIQAYDDADEEYNKYKNAISITTDQLNEANSNLSKAEAKLESLKAGYNAAHAAALAS